MGVLSYTCPRTSLEVRTSIEAEADTLLRMWPMKLFVLCPHCISGHSIRVRDTFIRYTPFAEAAE